jgi:hypothetical protein
LAQPKLWQPLKLSTLWPEYEYEYATDGRIRVRNGESRYELATFIGDGELCVRVRMETGKRQVAAVKELIAISVHGPAPRFKCEYCARVITSIRDKVVHLNGDPLDCSPDNLKYEPDESAGRQHELLCLEGMMQHSLVPAAAFVASYLVHEKIWFAE